MLVTSYFPSVLRFTSMLVRWSAKVDACGSIGPAMTSAMIRVIAANVFFIVAISPFALVFLKTQCEVCCCDRRCAARVSLFPLRFISGYVSC